MGNVFIWLSCRVSQKMENIVIYKCKCTALASSHLASYKHMEQVENNSLLNPWDISFFLVSLFFTQTEELKWHIVLLSGVLYWTTSLPQVVARQPVKNTSKYIFCCIMQRISNTVVSCQTTLVLNHFEPCSAVRNSPMEEKSN